MNMLFIGYNDGLGRVDLGGSAEARLVLQGPPVASVAVDPHEPDLIYAATLGDGLWRSRDAGATFEKSDFDAVLTWCATVSSCERIGGTGSLSIGTQMSAVFKSTDAGKSFEELASVNQIPSRTEWSFPPVPDTHHVHQIALHVDDPHVILFGVELGGVYHSSDGGRTWAQTSADPAPHTLRIHPAQPNLVYEAGGASYCESRDGGTSWRRHLDGIPDEVRYFYSLAVDSGDPANVLLSGARDPFSGHAVRNLDTSQDFLEERDAATASFCSDKRWRTTPGTASATSLETATPSLPRPILRSS